MTKIYTGLLGKFGDILCFTAILPKIDELFRNAEITFAIAKKFESIKPLLEQDPLIDNVFVCENYMENIMKYAKTKDVWSMIEDRYRQGYNYDLRGEDEIEEQAKHDIIFETRIRHREKFWWRKRHQVVNYAYNLGINMTKEEAQIRAYHPGYPLVRKDVEGDYVVIHNETMECKQYPFMEEVKDALKQNYNVLELKESDDWLKTAELLRNAALFIGVDSAPVWLSSAFNTPSIYIYGVNYFGEATKSIYPVNVRSNCFQSLKQDFSDIKPEYVLQHAWRILK